MKRTTYTMGDFEIVVFEEDDRPCPFCGGWWKPAFLEKHGPVVIHGLPHCLMFERLSVEDFKAAATKKGKAN